MVEPFCPNNGYDQVIRDTCHWGVEVSIYWAEFPVRYLDIIRSYDVHDLEKNSKVTRPQSLIVP